MKKITGLLALMAVVLLMAASCSDFRESEQDQVINSPELESAKAWDILIMNGGGTALVVGKTKSYFLLRYANDQMISRESNFMLSLRLKGVCRYGDPDYCDILIKYLSIVMPPRPDA